MTQTLYQIADAEIRACIDSYLVLAEATSGLTTIRAKHIVDARTRALMLAGFGMQLPAKSSAAEVAKEWKRQQAIPFDLETGITAGVYANIRAKANDFFIEVEAETEGFTNFTAGFIRQNPQFLPILQHVAGIFSKAKLKELVGSVNDNAISKPAAERLATLLSTRVNADAINKGEILQRLESTLEGIVRDLVGRVLLESIVDAALRRRKLRFQREGEYSALGGVVYDFRADFVLPSAAAPKAFVEVRKSSSRHASLYAKDKMFSAINWKGANRDLLAALVIDGEWTGETLRVMANVFDYVVPIARIDELAETLEAYLAGDRTKLKWIVEFQIVPNRPRSPA